MNRRLWLSVAMLAAGASLLLAASFASAGNNARALKQGGVLRLGQVGASGHVDPQIAYDTQQWAIEYATAAKLYNYPDKPGPAGSKLQPEVASRFTVSKDGRTYTFFIRKGFKFSNGKPVTPKNFRYAIDRTANHDLASPGSIFIADPAGTDIVGAEAVNAGNGTHVSGVVVKGQKLIIHLKKGDGTFMSKITTPFFQAISTSLPLTKEITTVNSTNDLPSAGPYTYSKHVVNQLTSLRRNKYYTKGPGRTRPHNLQGVDLSWNLDDAVMFQQTQANQLDEDPAIPPDNVQGLFNQYGLNKTRFWAKPVNCTGYLPMNMANSLFKGNTNLRKAVNYAISRGAYVAQSGPFAPIRISRADAERTLSWTAHSA